jgi:hypothetical protein
VRAGFFAGVFSATACTTGCGAGAAAGAGAGAGVGFGASGTHVPGVVDDSCLPCAQVHAEAIAGRTIATIVSTELLDCPPARQAVPRATA